MLIERTLAVPLFAAMLYLVGCLVMRLVGAFRPSIWTFDSSRIQAIFDRVAAGTGGLVLVLFLAGAVGLYRPGALVGLAALLVLLGLAAAWGEHQLEHTATGAGRTPGHVSDPDRSREDAPGTEPRSAAPAGWRWFLALLAIGWSGFFVLLALQAIRPDLAWDSNVYHLNLPKLFLREGGFFAVPMNVYSHWPLGVDLLFGLAMAIHDHVLAKQVHYLFAILTAGLLFVVGARGASATTPLRAAHPGALLTGLLAVGLFFANPVVIFEARVAYVDIAFAFFTLVAAWAAERSLQGSDSDQRGPLVLLGIAAGLACATKLSGAFAAAAVLLVWALATARRSGWDVSWRRALVVLPSVLVLGGIWPLKSWWLTGNPVYPLFFGRFGGPDWSAELSAQHAAWQRSMGMGHEPLDYLLLPWRLIVHGGNGYQNFDGRLHLVWLVALPVIALGALRSPRVRRLLVISLLIFVPWALTSQQLRLLIPCLALLSWATAESVRGALTLSTTTSGARRRALHSAVALGCLLLLATAWFESRQYLRQTPSLLGRLLELGYDANDAVIHPIYRAVDELPPSARLLLLNTNHGFFLERPYLADSFFEASQIHHLLAPAEDAPAALVRLQRRGISHVLLQNRDIGMAYPPALVELLQSRQWSRVIYESPDGLYVLLELARVGARPGS